MRSHGQSPRERATGYAQLRWVQPVWLHPWREHKSFGNEGIALIQRGGPSARAGPICPYSEDRDEFVAQGTYPDRCVHPHWDRSGVRPHEPAPD